MLRKFFKNNKGSTYLTKLPQLMSIFLFLVFIMDVSFMGVQYIGTSAVATNLANKLALQGGLIGTGEYDYNIDQASYVSRVTNSQIIEDVYKRFTVFGIPQNKWQIVVNGQAVYDRGASKLRTKSTIKYGGQISVNITFEYDWRFGGKLFSFGPTLISSRGSAMSEYF